MSDEENKLTEEEFADLDANQDGVLTEDESVKEEPKPADEDKVEEVVEKKEKPAPKKAKKTTTRKKKTSTKKDSKPAPKKKAAKKVEEVEMTPEEMHLAELKRVAAARRSGGVSSINNWRRRGRR